MRYTLLLSLLFCLLPLSAQQAIYVWAPSGLSLRAEPRLDAEKIAIIPYGSTVSPSGIVTPFVVEVPALPARRIKIGDGPDNFLESEPYVMEEGFTFVQFGDSQGYVYAAYLLPFAPPPKLEGPMSAKEWMDATLLEPFENQGSEKNGDEIFVASYEGGILLRTDFQNDFQLSEIVLPNLSLAQAFVVADRLFNLTHLITHDPAAEDEDWWYTKLETDKESFLYFFGQSVTRVQVVGGFAIISQEEAW